MLPPKKILMVSMPTLHFFRWVDQLKNEGFEVYWFDVTDGGQFIEKIPWVNQITGWKLKWNYPGRIFIKKRFPKLSNLIQKINTQDTATVFEKYLEIIKPDIVHSFALYVSCAPIFKVMKKHSALKWIYSSWGSDLYYFQNKLEYLKDIKAVLPRIDYLFTDCKRDYQIAQNHGFKGEFLGVFPGGGGFDFELMKILKQPQETRNTILIKGFQGRSGRVITVLKALELLNGELDAFEIVVFGADKETFKYIEQSTLKEQRNFNVLGKIIHEEVLKLMGKSKIYIGNSNSDGMPNTLLEAMCMDVFPIQSNPGNATAEIIKHGKNGFLIENCEDFKEIQEILVKTLINKKLIKSALKINKEEVVPQLERTFIKNKVVKIYDEL